MSCHDKTTGDNTFVLCQSAELVGLAFHTSVLACILRQRAKGISSFRSGFFTIYVIQSIADIVHYPLELVYFRLGTIGCLSPRAFDFPQGNIVYFFYTYAGNIEFAAHAAIGVNRFCVLSDAWTSKRQRIVLIAIFLSSLPVASLRLIGRMTLVETGEPGVFVLKRESPWVGTLLSVSWFVFTLATTTVSIVFELAALARYKRLTASSREKYHNDFRLLVYALLLFGIQLAISISYGLFMFGAICGYLQLASSGQSAMKHLSLAFWISPSICLLWTSKHLRNAFVNTYSLRWRQTSASSPVVVMTPSAR